MKNLWKELKILVAAITIGGIITFLALCFNLLDKSSGGWIDEPKFFAAIAAPYLLLLAYRMLRFIIGTVHEKNG